MILLNEILDLSKIESGTIQLENEPFSLIKAIEDTVAIQMVTAREKGIDLQFKLSSFIDHQSRGDFNRIRQLLMNILGNAIKFTHQGCVCVSVELLKLAGEKALYKIDVKDTGIGIPEDVELFNRFTQVDSSTSREYGGTGLGLVISKSIASMMNGDITYQSELGKGTTFSITLELGVVNSEFSLLNKKVIIWGKEIPFAPSVLDSFKNLGVDAKFSESGSSFGPTDIHLILPDA